MIELIKKTEAERLLDRFIDSEENPENTIRLVFVPEELYNDLKDPEIPIRLIGVTVGSLEQSDFKNLTIYDFI